MAIAYQYTSAGIYAGNIEDYGILPHNATYTTPPDVEDGHILQWDGTAWHQVENHKGDTGYVNGESYTIKNYGPYPDGWSADAPEPTTDERMATLRAGRDARITATTWLVERHRDQQDAGADTTLTAEEYAAVLAYRQALRDLPAADGAPDVAYPTPPACVAAMDGWAYETAEA